MTKTATKYPWRIHYKGVTEPFYCRALTVLERIHLCRDGHKVECVGGPKPPLRPENATRKEALEAVPELKALMVEWKAKWPKESGMTREDVVAIFRTSDGKKLSIQTVKWLWIRSQAYNDSIPKNLRAALGDGTGRERIKRRKEVAAHMWEEWDAPDDAGARDPTMENL